MISSLTVMRESTRFGCPLQQRTCILAFAALGLLFHSPADAKKRPHPRHFARIRTITIEPTNVFDPHVEGENHWPFTWANAVHITTRQRVIREELLFKPGDAADPEVFAESERVLRS